MYISQNNYTYDLFLYTNLIELVYVWFMKMDGIRYRYVPSPLSRGACFCPLSFYYVFARDPLVTLCGHVAFRCNVICCMFVLFKSSVGVGQGFMCHYLALCFMSEPEMTPFLSSVGAFMLDRWASKVE